MITTIVFVFHRYLPQKKFHNIFLASFLIISQDIQNARAEEACLYHGMLLNNKKSQLVIPKYLLEQNNTKINELYCMNTLM